MFKNESSRLELIQIQIDIYLITRPQFINLYLAGSGELLDRASGIFLLMDAWIWAPPSSGLRILSGFGIMGRWMEFSLSMSENKKIVCL